MGKLTRSRLSPKFGGQYILKFYNGWVNFPEIKLPRIVGAGVVDHFCILVAIPRQLVRSFCCVFATLFEVMCITPGGIRHFVPLGRVGVVVLDL